MVEIGKAIDLHLEKATGADRTAWARRAREFARNPDRRRLMYQKLVDLLRMKTGGDEPIKQEGVRPNPVEVINDTSGLITYVYKLNPKKILADTAISLAPENARISEWYQWHGNKFWENGPNFGFKVNGEDPSRFHLVATPMGVVDPGYNDSPILGLARGESLISEFVSKNPDSKTNEFESGGIKISAGNLEILSYSELTSSIGEGMVEQATFTADSESWRDIANLPAYHLDGPFTPLFVGNMNSQDGQKRMFVAIYNGSRGGMSGFFTALNDTASRENYSSWEVACLDFGGVFAGVAQNTVDVGLKIAGPSLFDNKDPRLVDTGHKRTRFLDISWPREE